MKRRLSNANGSRFAKYARTGFSLARAAYKHYSKRTNAGGGSAPVTSQFDVRTTYKGKRLSSRGKKNLRRKRTFTRKVLKAADTRNAIQKLLFVENIRMTSAANAQQMSGSHTYMNAINGSAAGDRDINQIFVAIGDTTTSHTKLYTHSNHMDLSILNTGANGCYVECYYWVGRKRLSTNLTWDAAPITTLDQGLQSGLTAQPTNAGGTTLQRTTYGATPFQNMLTKFIKIYKKQVIHLGVGQITDISLGNTGDRLLSMELTDGILLDKRSKGVILLLYGDPNTAVDATAGQPLAASINYNVTRTYNVTSDRPGLVDQGTSLLAA